MLFHYLFYIFDRCILFIYSGCQLQKKEKQFGAGFLFNTIVGHQICIQLSDTSIISSKCFRDDATVAFKNLISFKIV